MQSKLILLTSIGNLPKMSDVKQKINASSMDAYSKGMLLHAVDAVNYLEAWSELSAYSPPEDKGFMWSTDSIVTRVTDEICKRDDSHSGSSMAWTMRAIEYIAKKGVDAYLNPEENSD